MNKITYPEPDYKNTYYKCYKNHDNPALVFTSIVNGSLSQWYEIDKATKDALIWAELKTKQVASTYRGIILALPTFGGWRVYFGSRYITAKRSGASCAGVRFERLSDVQRFRAAALKTLEVLR